MELREVFAFSLVPVLLPKSSSFSGTSVVPAYFYSPFRGKSFWLCKGAKIAAFRLLRRYHYCYLSTFLAQAVQIWVKKTVS